MKEFTAEAQRAQMLRREKKGFGKRDGVLHSIPPVILSAAKDQ